MAEWVTVAQTDEVEAGKVKYVEVDGKQIALCHVEGEGFYAIDDVCTHDGGSLNQGSLMGSTIECPRHGAKFDVRTGAVRTLPAAMPVGSHEVKVEGTDVKVALG